MYQYDVLFAATTGYEKMRTCQDDTRELGGQKQNHSGLYSKEKKAALCILHVVVLHLNSETILAIFLLTTSDI